MKLWEFFDAAGVTVIQGYGLTETSPVISVNPVSKNRPESVGPPIENVSVRIAPDGEIEVSGPSVMQGYWQLPEETKRWLRGHILPYPRQLLGNVLYALSGRGQPGRQPVGEINIGDGAGRSDCDLVGDPAANVMRHKPAHLRFTRLGYYERHLHDLCQEAVSEAAGVRPTASRTQLVNQWKGEGVAHREIARRLGINDKAVRKLLRRLGWEASHGEQISLGLESTAD